MKYELLADQKKVIGDITVYRIRALKDFAHVKAGDLGGWIQSEANLTQSGLCWVGGEAIARDFAQVSGDAVLMGRSVAMKECEISGDSVVAGFAVITDSVKISNNAYVCDNAQVSGGALVFDNAQISGDASIIGGQVYGCSRVEGHAAVTGNAIVCGAAFLSGDAFVSGDAIIYDTDRYLTISPFGADALTLTAHRDKELGIRVNVGEFSGSVSDLTAYAAAKDGVTVAEMQEHSAMIAFIEAALPPHDDE